MTKWFVGTVVFFLVYLFFMVTLIPAQWVVNQISLPKNVMLQGVEGSIWKGRIQRVVLDGYTINKVNTEVNLLALIMFNPTVDATFGGALVNGPEGKATVSHLLGDIELNDAEISVSANDIAQQLPLPIPLTAQKFIDINISQFVMGQPLCQQLSGDIQWNKAAIKALDQKVNLGTLSGELTCDKGRVKFTVNPKNDLGLTFDAYVQSPERISGSGYLKPGKNFPAVLKEGLPFIGNADNKGRYKLNF